MALISKKKIPFPISDSLRQFLVKYEKDIAIPLTYKDLLRYVGATTLYDAQGEDTLWLSVYYAPGDHEHIYGSLKQIYALLKASGEVSVIEHLYIDRIDICTYGNTRPFRVRVVNRINDNFDYFYVKVADASRIYGLELEDILSPNRISYLIYRDTLIEEHIAGLPGDMFIKNYLNKDLNRIRLAKEFVKFNERCFVRLLGDMHSSNFVIDITPDFEELHYRIRAIDFDQQSYEGRKAVYMPQYYKQNNPILEVGYGVLTPESVRQYQREERSLIANRMKTSRHVLRDVLSAMIADQLSTSEYEGQLKHELCEHYKDDFFLRCRNMGEILQRSLQIVWQSASDK